MAELEIHHESEHSIDPAGQRVGVLAALLAVLLALVSICSHRTHTEAIMLKSGANDAWEHYQSTRIKYHNLELGENLVNVFGSKGESAGKMLADYDLQKTKYDREGKQIEEEARQSDAAAERAEHRGLRYDIGEGLLEIALVLSSLYFISRKKMFPAIGVAAGVMGAAVAASGLLV